jgi:hypothetical protein
MLSTLLCFRFLISFFLSFTSVPYKHFSSPYLCCMSGPSQFFFYFLIVLIFVHMHCLYIMQMPQDLKPNLVVTDKRTFYNTKTNFGSDKWIWYRIFWEGVQLTDASEDRSFRRLWTEFLPR